MNPVPIFEGRFNYLSFKADMYNVVFVPFRGAAAMIIARNLSKEDALNMISEFNETIDLTRKEIEEISINEEGGRRNRGQNLA